jgi:hypothetical protein
MDYKHRAEGAEGGRDKEAATTWHPWAPLMGFSSRQALLPLYRIGTSLCTRLGQRFVGADPAQWSLEPLDISHSRQRTQTGTDFRILRIV